MKTEKQSLQKTVEMMESERDHLDQQIWEKEMEHAKKHETVSRPVTFFLFSFFFHKKSEKVRRGELQDTSYPGSFSYPTREERQKV